MLGPEIGGSALGKSAYTDEEIKQVFQTLFTEKKRLKELEQQLEALRKETNPSFQPKASPEILNENQTLKLLLASQKQKYDELANSTPSSAYSTKEVEETYRHQKSTISKLEEDNKLLEEENKAFLKQFENLKSLLLSAKKDAAAYQQKAQQAEKELSKANEELAHNRSIASQPKPPLPAEKLDLKQESIEAANLRLQNQHLQKSLTETQEQNYRQKIRLEKLAQAIQEKEKRIQELYQYETTYKKTSEQRQNLQNNFEKTVNENKIAYAELEQTREHANQLERIVKFLRERSEEDQAAIKQYKIDLISSQELFQKLQKELLLLQNQFEAAKNSVVHTDEEKQELNNELTALKIQLEQLKRALVESQTNNLTLETALKEADKTTENVKDNALKLTEQLNRQNALVDDVKKEVEIIKQALIRGMREAHELEARFKDSIQEKVAVLNKFHQARQILEKQEREIQSLKEELIHSKAYADRNLSDALELSKEKENEHQKFIEKMESSWQQERETTCARERQLKNDFEIVQTKLQSDHLSDLEKLQSQMQNLNQSYQSQIQDLHEQIHSLQNKLELAADVETENQSLLVQYEKLRIDFASAGAKLNESLKNRQELEIEFQSMLTRYHEKERKLDEMQENANRFYQEKQQLQESLNKSTAELEEKELHIKMAQQHLAKKVKETAHLSDEVERYKQQAYDHQQQQVQHQIRSAELQASLDIHIQQERRLQEQLSEVIKTYDSQVKKWEQKYFEIQDKWQATELRKKELEKLEERHFQMQALLANLGSVMGSPIQQPTPLPSQTIGYHHPEPILQPQQVKLPEPEQQLSPAIPEEDLPPPKPYQNLFNLPKTPEKHRQNLFD